MVPLLVFGGLVIVGLAVLIFFKIKWGRSGRAETRGRAENIENEKTEAAAKAEARRKN